MDTAQWKQGFEVDKPVDKKPRPQKEQSLNCPRCKSTNTKFCYYNNYSLSQPRYFCKTCRRYWTEGGCLRNVPVGGGPRKNKRSSSNIIISSTSAKKLVLDTNLVSPPKISPQKSQIHEGQDLNLAYNPFYRNGFSEFVGFPLGGDTKNDLNPQNPNINSNPCSSSCNISAMEFLKSRELSSFMCNSMPVSDSNSVYNSSGFPVHGFKPTLSFSLDGDSQGVQNHTNLSRIGFPFEELKPVSSNDLEFDDQDRVQGESNGYWNGMLAGGSW